MNIHEHQAKEILKKYGAVVPNGFFALSVEELVEKAKSLKTEKLVLKAQIHAGGRGKYPKKRQWCLENIKTKHDWVFMLDADEIVTDAFINELKRMSWKADGYFVKSDIVWKGKRLKYGMGNNKLCLFRRSVFHYPIVDDLDIGNLGEIEGHYQPVPTMPNMRIGQIYNPLIHYNKKNNWVERHDKYAEWEIGMNERNVWPLDPIFHRELVKDALRTARLRPYVFFIYGYILKGGFLHGKVGLDYALKRFSYNRRISRAARQTSD